MQNRTAIAIASVALFFSLTGAGMAAQHFLITSKRQIAPWVRAALRGPRGVAGRQGSTGAQGPQGAEGPAGKVGATPVEAAQTVPVGESDLTATCSGRPSGGGFKTSAGVAVLVSEPSGNSWLIEVQNDSDHSQPVAVWAICP